MRHNLTHFLLFLLVIVMMGSSAYAQEEKIIPIEVNKGQLVRLSKPATSVAVADKSIADIHVMSSRAIYVQAKKVGDTSILALDSNDNVILDATIEVTHNISKLNRSLKAIIPDAEVNFRSVDGGLVVDGNADSPTQSEAIRNLASSFLGDKEKLVNMINTSGSDQVMLQVKVAEVARSELKRFGINIAGAFTGGNFAFQLLQGRTFVNAATSAVTRNNADNSIYGNYDGGKYSLGGIIDALEDNGLVSVLAEPSLTTTSGKTANFLAGGEFPIPLVDADGKVTVSYKPFGISLNFTPVVLSKDKISLSVAPEVSTISSTDSLSLGTTTTFVIPSLQTRRAETTVELGSGQTFAIAGLFKNDQNNSVDKFPGLGDLPVLGALFRSQEFKNNQTELVILVTPYIVRPVDKKEKLLTPLDGFVPPTDLSRILDGNLSGEHATEADDPHAPHLNGDGGFILE